MEILSCAFMETVCFHIQLASCAGSTTQSVFALTSLYIFLFLNLHIYDYSFQDYLRFQHLKSGNYIIIEKGCRDSVLSVHIYISAHVNSSYTE